jgi:hypothetical protein
MSRSTLTLALLLTFVVRPSAQVAPEAIATLADASTVVLTGRVDAISVQRDAGSIYSYVSVGVSAVLKGDVPGPSVVLKQLGGTLPDLGLYVADQATFRVGEEVLLFLSVRPRDGTLTTVGLAQGKWLVLPDLQTGSTVAVNGNSRVMLDDALVAAVSKSSARSMAFLSSPQEVSAPNFTFIPGYEGRPARWHEADDGATISVDFQSNTTASVLNDAIGGWNAVGTRLQLRAGASFGAPSSGCTDFRDRAAIAFFWNDPCGEVPDDGVTMGYGGGYFTPGLRKTINGVTFDRFLEGFAILNNGEPLQSRPECRTDAALHVLGHAIGLGDSDRSSAVMWRELRSSCTGLAQDDLDGLRFIYPPTASGGSPPQAPTAITSSVVLNSVTLTWTPATSGGPAQSYIIEASLSPGFVQLIASLPTSDASTSLGVGGVQTGRYFVRVRARNPLGTSPPSPTTEVNVGACAPPGAPTNLAYSTADNLVSITWTPPASGVTQGYWLYAGFSSGESNALVTPLGPTPAFAGSAPFGTYYVRVAASNSCGVGPVTADLAVTVQPCTSAPSPPTGLAYTRSGSVVTLTWNNPSSGNLPSRFIINAGSAPGQANLLVYPTGNNARSFTAAAGPGRYYVSVAGQNNCGTSLVSNEVEVVIP